MYYTLDFEQLQEYYIGKIGVDREVFLRESGVSPRTIQNNKLQLTPEQYKELIRATDKYINEETIVAMSKVDTVASFNPEFFAGLCAENGLECIKRIAKYKRIVAPVQMMICEDDEHVSISYVYYDGEHVPQMMCAHTQVSILSIIRKGTGVESIVPVRIVIPEGYSQKTIDYLGVVPFIKKQKNEIVFRKQDLKRPFVTKNNRMWDCLENELNQRLREIEMDRSFAALVRKTLIELLPSGVSDAEKISIELGVSKRTLQRRLSEEHTTFNEQLNHTRELMVRNYLGMNIHLEEIAFLVNYSDAKALSRAFKVWTGMSISEYKKIKSSEE